MFFTLPSILQRNKLNFNMFRNPNFYLKILILIYSQNLLICKYKLCIRVWQLLMVRFTVITLMSPMLSLSISNVTRRQEKPVIFLILILVLTISMFECIISFNPLINVIFLIFNLKDFFLGWKLEKDIDENCPIIIVSYHMCTTCVM